jgi:hypothetical protein
MSKSYAFFLFVSKILQALKLQIVMQNDNYAFQTEYRGSLDVNF